MDKIRISRKRRTSSLNTLKKENQLIIKKGVKLKKFNPNKYLSKEFLGKAILECFFNNDPNGIVELLEIYIQEHNKVEFCKEAKIPRSTTYQSFKHKNPTIKTVAKIMSMIE